MALPGRTDSKEGRELGKDLPGQFFDLFVEYFPGPAAEKRMGIFTGDELR